MDKIYSINGPVVKVKNTKSFSMLEMVYVGKKGLFPRLSELPRILPLFRSTRVRRDLCRESR